MAKSTEATAEGIWLGSKGTSALALEGDIATVNSLNNLIPKKGWFDLVIHGDSYYTGSAFNIFPAQSLPSDASSKRNQRGLWEIENGMNKRKDKDTTSPGVHGRFGAEKKAG